MNKKALVKDLVKYLGILAIILFIGYFTRSNFNEILLADEASIGWFWGVFGTLYALITAFVLVGVWEQFNGFSNEIAKEAKTITSIWNYTDYLDDTVISKKMEEALVAYLKTVSGSEAKKMARAARIVHPSKELVGIMEVIDKIKFDDPRDESAFKEIIRVYEELSTVRNERIESSVTRLPPLLKGFFVLISSVFVLGYLVHGFVNPVLYYSTLIAVSTIVFFANMIIFDMDNPVDGIWNVSFEAFKNSLSYIKSRKHTK